MLVLDAILTGAKGVNLWSSFRVAPPQRKSGSTRRSSSAASRLSQRRAAGDG